MFAGASCGTSIVTAVENETPFIMAGFRPVTLSYVSCWREVVVGGGGGGISV